jgi:hypothetical protein
MIRVPLSVFERSFPCYYPTFAEFLGNFDFSGDASCAENKKWLLKKFPKSDRWVFFFWDTRDLL